ncbi:aminoacyl-tRNA deacylase [Phyllobacterium sp. LjRoot231]|uniref:aminoacyl-tRNA deacylase n=1 Tax=Phyllobacterium sp. LjRoot231 TaxID=3342289 RepID=UPI003F502BCE
MTIARKLQDCIDGEGIAYDTVAHHRTATTSQPAQAALVPGSRLAKSVVVHHEIGYVLAVVPSTHRIELSTLQDVIDRRLGLGSEEAVSSLFADCDIGAVPPTGSARLPYVTILGRAPRSGHYEYRVSDFNELALYLI